MTKAEKYITSRDLSRINSKNGFLKFKPEANEFIAATNELVASLTFFCSGKNLSTIDNGPYIGRLIASFCRSHFIASDLIIGGELIEAATIIRKQMELISRLHELIKGLDINTLLNKTPNIKHLGENVRRLYSDYSAIAHSAEYDIMCILGNTTTAQGNFASLYPEFQKNAYVTMQHLVLTSLEFYSWCVGFYSKYLTGYDNIYDAALLKSIISLHEQLYPQN